MSLVRGELAGELRRQGFTRVAAFTGNTLDTERERLLRDWGEDRIDLMVATSAFGVGVDKADVRTVVHACMPENLDRYYQEVGRGGRDGCSAVSLLCYTPDDLDVAYSLSSGKVITVEKAFARWEAMRHGAQFLSNRATVNIDAVPVHITETHGDGERNRDGMSVCCCSCSARDSSRWTTRGLVQMLQRLSPPMGIAAA